MDVPRVNELQTLSSEPSRAGSDFEDAAVQLLDGLKRQKFTNSRTLRETLEDRRDELQQDETREQYIVFTAVPTSEFSRLSSDHSPTTKYCRLSYHATSRILVAKVIPSPEHETAAELFKSLIALEMHAMNLEEDIDPLGSTTVTIGDWKKEADCSWGPSSTTAELSFVVEVGLSESSRHLALDARGWLETNASPVKLVVTIDINRSSPELVLSRWEAAPRHYHVLTRTPSLSARRTKTLRIFRFDDSTIINEETNTGRSNGTTATTAQLDLPFEKVVGRPPNLPMERDFVVSEQQLRRFAEKIWKKQGFG